MSREYEDDETELEPSDAERIALLFAAGMILADIITHPEGARKILEQ